MLFESNGGTSSPLDFFCQNILATAIGAFVNFASAMLALAKLEILNTIVRAISIDMVDSFPCFEGSPKMLFHDNPMF